MKPETIKLIAQRGLVEVSPLCIQDITKHLKSLYLDVNMSLCDPAVLRDVSEAVYEILVPRKWLSRRPVIITHEDCSVAVPAALCVSRLIPFVTAGPVIGHPRHWWPVPIIHGRPGIVFVDVVDTGHLINVLLGQAAENDVPVLGVISLVARCPAVLVELECNARRCLPDIEFVNLMTLEEIRDGRGNDSR